MDETILADVEISRAGTALPVVGPTAGEVLLESVVVGEVEHRLAQRHDLLEDQLLTIVESYKATVSVVDDPHGRGESELAGTHRTRQRIAGIGDAASDDGIHGDIEFSGRRKCAELLIQDLETLFGDLVG